MNKKPLRKIKDIKSTEISKPVCRFWDLAARLEHRGIKKVRKNKKGRR